LRLGVTQYDPNGSPANQPIGEIHVLLIHPGTLQPAPYVHKTFSGEFNYKKRVEMCEEHNG